MVKHPDQAPQATDDNLFRDQRMLLEQVLQADDDQPRDAHEATEDAIYAEKHGSVAVRSARRTQLRVLRQIIESSDRSHREEA